MNELMIEQQQKEDLEEAHYVHTINAFVSLIEKYGWNQVISDLREQMGNKTWQ